MLHTLLGRVPSGGEYIVMQDATTRRPMRFEIKHVATANVYYVAVSTLGLLAPLGLLGLVGPLSRWAR